MPRMPSASCYWRVPDKLAVPVYAQVQQMFAQRFAEAMRRKVKRPYWKPIRPRPIRP